MIPLLHETGFAHLHPHGELLVLLAGAVFAGIWGVKLILKKS